MTQILLVTSLPSFEAAMRKIAVLLGCTWALLGCGSLIRHRTPDTHGDEDTVRHLEETVAAATERNDADTLDRYLAPDFTFVNPNGLLVTKEQFLANFRSGRLLNTSYKVDEMRVRIYGAAAVVTYRSTVAGTAGVQDRAPVRRRTTMLIKRDGAWLIVAQQSTPVVTR